MFDIVKFNEVKEYSHCKDNGMFINALANDGKIYQIKLHPSPQKGNANELIGSYIAHKASFPSLEGNFIYIDDKAIRNDILPIVEETKCNIDLNFFKKNIFFGIEWIKDMSGASSFKELYNFVHISTNQNEFLSVFAYDQYLKNQDRHPGNILIYKQSDTKKPKIFNFIDCDRIFNGLNWSDIDDKFINDFRCMKGWSKHLYRCAIDTVFTDALKYAVNIENIKDNDIDDLVSIIKLIYNISMVEYHQIEKCLKERKEEFYMKMLSTQECHKVNKDKKLCYNN